MAAGGELCELDADERISILSRMQQLIVQLWLDPSAKDYEATTAELVELIDNFLAQPPISLPTGDSSDGGAGSKVLFAGLLRNPWLPATTTSCSAARPSSMDVQLGLVYRGDDTQLFSTHPALAEHQPIDGDGVVVAMEMRHFVRRYATGWTPAVELAHLPCDCRLIVSDAWLRLLAAIDIRPPPATEERQGGGGGGEHTVQVYPTKFITGCRGRALHGSSAEKRLLQTASSEPGAKCMGIMCEAVKLMSHLDCVVRGDPLILSSSQEADLGPQVKALLELVREYGDRPDVAVIPRFSQRLRQCSDAVQARLDDVLLETAARNEQLITALGLWVKETGLGGRVIGQIDGADPRAVALLNQVIEACPNGPLANYLSPGSFDDLVLVTRVGSCMYNLATQSSDADYIIVYTNPLDSLLSAVRPPKESCEYRGPSLTVEYGCYELRKFAEMLHKGSVNMLELVFCPQLDYTGPAWQELRDNAHLFVSETAIAKYTGYAKSHLKRLEDGKPESVGREAKLTYHILHKLHGVSAMADGGRIPPVRLEGSIREEILGVRTGGMPVDQLIELARSRYEAVKTALSARTAPLRENCDAEFLRRWCTKARRYPCD